MNDFGFIYVAGFTIGPTERVTTSPTLIAVSNGLPVEVMIVG